VPTTDARRHEAGQTVGDYSTQAMPRMDTSAAAASSQLSTPRGDKHSGSGINATVEMIGSWSSGSSSHGFLHQTGVFTIIDFPLATRTTPLGINDSGRSPATYNTAGGNTHGFIYSAGRLQHG
jgi:hypothetical protein